MAPKILGFTLPTFRHEKAVVPDNPAKTTPPADLPHALVQLDTGPSKAKGGWLEKGIFSEWPKNEGKLSDGNYNANVYSWPRQSQGAPTGPMASLKGLERTNRSLETVDALEGSKAIREEIQKDIDQVRRDGGYAHLQTVKVDNKPVHLLFTGADKVTAYFDDIFPKRQVGTVARDQTISWKDSRLAHGNAAFHSAEGQFNVRD